MKKLGKRKKGCLSSIIILGVSATVLFFAFIYVPPSVRVINNTSRRIDAVSIYFTSFGQYVETIYYTENLAPNTRARGTLSENRRPTSHRMAIRAEVMLDVSIDGAESTYGLIGYMTLPFGNIRIVFSEADDGTIYANVRFRERYFRSFRGRVRFEAWPDGTMNEWFID